MKIYGIYLYQIIVYSLKNDFQKINLKVDLMVHFDDSPCSLLKSPSKQAICVYGEVWTDTGS